MQITCPQCGTPVAAEDLNMQALVARCVPCNSIFNFTDQVIHEGPVLGRRAPVPRPASIQVTGNGEVLVLSRRWFTAAAIFLTFFCVFWDGFLMVWYGAALFGGKGVNVAMLLFPLIHVAVGVGLTYFTLSLYLNSTVITLTRRDLEIKHGPLKWVGDRTLPLSEVDQFYSEEIRGSKGSRSYTLSVILKNGTKQRLLSGLPDPGTALYLEQQLEQWFGIEDRPVGDEITR